MTILVLSVSAMATEYYVDPNGNDASGNGSRSNPWKTLSYACSQISANRGDTIHLNSGVIVETRASIVPLGVNIEGEGPDNTILKSSINDWLIKLWSSFVVEGNQTLSNFTIEGQNRKLDHGILIHGRHNVVVHHVNFREIDNTGLEIVSEYGHDKNNPPSIYLRGIEVYKCTFTNCSEDFNGWSGGCMQIGHLDGALIYDITIDENRGYGIKYWEGGWFKGIKIYNCNIKVPLSDASWSADVGIELWNLYDDCEVYENNINTWFSFVYGNKGNGIMSIVVHDNNVIVPGPVDDVCGIEVAHGLSDVEIYNNYVENVNYGVAIWGVSNQPQSNILIHHNIFYDINQPNSWNSGIEIHANSLFSDISIYNNVFHNVRPKWGTIGVKKIDSGKLKNLIVKNNIFINSVTNAGELILNLEGPIENAIASNNMYYNVEEGDKGNFQNNKNEIPQLKMTGDRPNPFYRPFSEDSNVIDAGIDVGLHYLGVAPDIGAYEYTDNYYIFPPKNLRLILIE